MGRPLLAAIAVLLSLVPVGRALGEEELVVRYPAVQHPYYAKRDVYFVRLLTMALERSGEKYRLVDVEFSEYSEKRSVLLIKTDQYDVHWLNTTAERERQLLPVRVPLHKGVIGWRVFFIRPEMQPVFAQVDSLEDLRQYVYVQGHDWADVDILLKNGLAIERSPNWQGMFKMVELNRAQAFPRSITEVVAEHQEPVAKNLVIEKTLILRYPAAYYYFVAKNNDRLKNAIEKGLMNSIEDGSFDRLFFETFGQQFAQLNLEDRKIISIGNPFLQMPLNDPRLWFSIDLYKRAEASSIQH